MTLHPNDKRNFHGALAIRSPYRIKPVRCVVCSRLIGDACNIVPDSELCHACFLAGWREPGRDGPGASPRLSVVELGAQAAAAMGIGRAKRVGAFGAERKGK